MLTGRDHHDLHRLPVGHGPAADPAVAGQLATARSQGGRILHDGQVGLLVNIFAVIWGFGMALNLAWPREAVYGVGWYNAWGAFIYIGVIVGVGFLWYCSGAGTLRHPRRARGESTPRRFRVRRVTATKEGMQASATGEFDYVIVGGGRPGASSPPGCRRTPTSPLPARGRPDRRGRRRHPGAGGLDGAAGLRLRLGLPRRTAGERQQLPAPRPGEGARRMLLAQLVHRVLAPRGGPRRVGRGRRHRVGRRDGLAAGPPAGEQRRRRAGTARRPGDGCRTCRRRPVRRGAARGGRRGRAAHRAVQPGRDGAAGRGLLPDQRSDGTRLSVARLPAPDHGIRPNLEAGLAAGQRDAVR